MNKNKLKELYKRLDSLEGSLPIGDTQEFLDRMLKQETENFVSNFKSNPTVKYLDGFNAKLVKFKKDFNLAPIIKEIEKIQSDLSTSQEMSVKEFERVSKSQEQKYNELSRIVSTTRAELENMNAKEVGKLLARIDTLQSELSYQSKDSTQKGQSLNSVMGQLETKIESILGELKAQIIDRTSLSNSVESRFKQNSEVITRTAESIDKLRQEMMNRVGRGGSANRQINVNSSVMSSKYTDINFQSDTAIQWGVSNDDTNKRVNITASLVSGGSGGATNPAGANTQIQFNDGGSFGASSTLTWNKTTSVLSVGNSTNSSIFSVNGPSSILQMTGGATISGNVGIGTASPGQKLRVKGLDVAIAGERVAHIGGATSWDTNDYEELAIGYNGIRSVYQGSADSWALQLVAGTSAEFASQTQTPKMTILANGNVGIGTKNPGAKLEVGLQGSVAGTIRTAGASSGYVQIQPASVAGNWTFTLPANDGNAGQYLITDGNGITQWASVTSGSGITRNVTSTAVSSTIGAVASTDYVVFATAGVQLTLPTAISNTNLYTIKNMGSSSVLLATSAGETIDGSDTALLPTQYQSLSLASNNSVWGVV